MVPNEPFMVTRYTLTNPSATKSYNWDVLDQVRLDNTNGRADVARLLYFEQPHAVREHERFRAVRRVLGRDASAVFLPGWQ